MLIQVKLDLDFLNKILNLSLINKKNIIKRKDFIKNDQLSFLVKIYHLQS